MAPTSTAKIEASHSQSSTSLRRRPLPSDPLHRAVTERIFALLKAKRIRLVDPTPSHSSSKVYMPRYDLYDDPPSNLTTATFELPGLKRDEVKVNIDEDGYLVVGGYRHRPSLKHAPNSISRNSVVFSDTREMEAGESEDDSETCYKVEEIRYGEYKRRIPLPPGTTTDDIHAHLSEGMLLVTWPRSLLRTSK